MNTKLYSALLLVTSISLSGCQTPKIMPPETETIKIMAQTSEIADKKAMSEAEKRDSDGDGVVDYQDACPGTPNNTVVDARGCSSPLDIIEEPTDDSYALYFENSSEIKSITYDRLDQISKALQRHEEGVMLIEGYIGKHESNKDNESLAKDRAEAIKSYVVLTYNINSERIRTYGCGLTALRATNETLEGREMNQWSYAMVRSEFSKSPYKCRMTL